ncbi:peptidase M16 [Sphingomonas sp. Leaf23]|uniref:M16 family metallopeptidase n=1 Tax=Sphingomonas sp. Leaf23 TaxID=1735689 RepID=UPI0006FC437F|nr:pitrilysin family protein [Sphingomonas sp. Leaf23]KQM87254.1 peptidase M16 [Sphingomonas sp. Leaf23]
MRFGLALLISTALLSPAHAQQRPAPAAPAASATVPPIAYTERTLANGLRVYAIRDTSSANVSVQVWYDVGSKDDPAGRSGFAHMFEHLMFKATRNLVPEQLDRLTEDVGGYNNASTADDYTNYYEVVPANHLQRLLFAEADRMATLVVDPKTFASEREVVKEELRSRILAQPYGKLFGLYAPMVSYSRHPYARPGIGSIADLDAATIDDIRAFHATYYRPDNAVLVVAGNFDPAQLNRWVDQYFAPIAKPNRPIPRVTVGEPVRQQPVTKTVYEANTPLPAILISYPLPPANHPDQAALKVLDAILSGGDNSRLHQSLVYRDQIAQDVGVQLDAKQGPGTLSLYAILAGGKSVADGEAALKREVASIIATPPTAAELAEAKNEITTAELLSRETAEGKASALAQGVIVERDPQAADKALAAIGRVTAADVQRVAKTWLAAGRAATVRYLPDTPKPAGAASDTIAVANSVVTAPLAVPPGITIHTPAAEGQRILPPAPAAPVQVAIPVPVERRLPNGMRVVLVEKRGVPVVTAALVAGGGAAADPDNRAGVGELTAGLLTQGTKTRSATEIARAVESLGGSIGSGAGWDSQNVTLTVGSAQAAPALGILADVARNPAFAQGEIDRLRTRTIDGVSVALTDPGQLSNLVADRAVFGGAPYGHPASGTPTTLKAITRADITAAYGRAWQPEQTTLVLVGDITPDAGMQLATQLFGDWRGQPQATPARPPEVAPPAPRVIVVDMSGAGQAGVVVARPGIARSDAAYFPAAVANATLGVGFSSRLNQEIRIKRGLAYGARSELDARRNGGAVGASTQTKNPSAPEVVKIITDEMRRMGAEPAPEAELATRKAVLTGNFGRTIERTSGIAGTIVTYVSDGVPLARIATFLPSIEAVGPAAVQQAAARVMDPKAASIVVVGDAKQFLEPLRAAYPQLVVIPAASIDLSRADLGVK